MTIMTETRPRSRGVVPKYRRGGSKPRLMKARAAHAPDAADPPIVVRKSTVHGTGVYAKRRIAEGERIIEYAGRHISWRIAQRRHPHDPAQPNHTFYFSLDNGEVIDPLVGGNDARWINHSCDPNCIAHEENGRIFIDALRNIDRGEELFYDYGIIIDQRHTSSRKKDFECFCGADNCRGTMLAPK